MGKMMGLTFILRMLDATTRSCSPPPPLPPSQSVSSSASLSWVWPSCKHPTTSSFRDGGDSMYKTLNSIYLDTSDGPCQTRCSSPSSAGGEEDEEEEEARPRRFSTAREEERGEEDEYSSVIRGMRSERLFFEPGSKTISMLEKEEREEEEEEEPKTITSIEETETVVVVAGDAEAKTVPFKESVAEEMESEDPYLDFRASMEEMVVAHGLKDWECLERLLGWYLSMNGKKTHGFILGAFVDLLLGLASSLQYAPPSSSCSSSSCSRSSSSTTTTSSSSDKSLVKDPA